jgi:hypothetical protein
MIHELGERRRLALAAQIEIESKIEAKLRQKLEAI